MQTLNDNNKRRVRNLLAELVRIDSAVSSTAQANLDRTEQRIARHLTDHLTQMGMTVELRELAPGRPNLIAHWPDQTGDHSVMLAAHMDTVTTEGMTVEPFAAEVRDGRIFGRGTCDTKGSMAAFLTALAIARETNRLPADKLYFVATASEETGCDGSVSLMQTGFRTDAAIVGEPTGCRVVTAHKGPAWLDIETFGQSCHASIPHQGRNAIDLMARIIQFINGPWADHLAARRHPLLGRSTCVVTLIEGGSKINIIPEHCRAQIDCRLIPEHANTELIDDFRRRLADCLGNHDLFKLTLTKQHTPLDCPADAPIVARLMGLCQEANGQRKPEAVDYFADTGPFSAAGITAALFGPGRIDQAHTADEFLELDQLYQATEITLSLLTLHAGTSMITGD